MTSLFTCDQFSLGFRSKLLAGLCLYNYVALASSDAVSHRLPMLFDSIPSHLILRGCRRSLTGISDLDRPIRLGFRGVMAADEDDDYMGDLERFIPKEELLPTKTASQIGKGKGTGGPKEKVNWKEKRKLKGLQKVKKEAEQRQDGLAAAIPSSNIGFKMLQQMGYKPGIALGKDGQGATEPIIVDVKVNRAGLGRDRVVAEEKVLKAKVKALVQEKKRRKVDELREGFQERRRGTWQSRKLVSDYRKAYTALLQLEERSLGSAEGLSTANRLEPSGIAVEREKEKDKERERGKEDKDGDADDEAEEEEEVITDEMLQEILTRLREVYNYCLYCGFQYDSQEQLQSDCPGEEEDAH